MLISGSSVPHRTVFNARDTYPEVAQGSPGPWLLEPQQSARSTFFASVSRGTRKLGSESWSSRPLATHLLTAPGPLSRIVALREGGKDLCLIGIQLTEPQPRLQDHALKYCS